jgi:hypothetical protein
MDPARAADRLTIYTSTTKTQPKRYLTAYGVGRRFGVMPNWLSVRFFAGNVTRNCTLLITGDTVLIRAIGAADADVLSVWLPTLGALRGKTRIGGGCAHAGNDRRTDQCNWN